MATPTPLMKMLVAHRDALLAHSDAITDSHEIAVIGAVCEAIDAGRASSDPDDDCDPPDTPPPSDPPEDHIIRLAVQSRINGTAVLVSATSAKFIATMYHN